MSDVIYRFDYARFKIEVAPENWEAIYNTFREARATFKASGDFDKSHKTNRLWFNAQAGKETWALDVWGEWAGIVWSLPEFWFKWLTRLDVRTTLWDADGDAVEALGVHLVKAKGPYNVHLFSSRSSTKRMGRDRGGSGFAIGSHKSDLRITVYKRASEPVACEFQMTGRYLARSVEAAYQNWLDTSRTQGLWYRLKELVIEAGQHRFERALEQAGIGTYWPLTGPLPTPELPPLQSAMPLGGPDDDYTVTMQYTGP